MEKRFRIVGVSQRGSQNITTSATEEKARKAWKSFTSFYWPEGYDAYVSGATEFTWRGITFKLEEC